ncbi:PREDICTED: nidogen-2 isoform X2 [Dinoponera quadriceps]|uniref:Nidogen-2 isoform X2 n=1 Tax=Dinoponera quadriceps TaxID=609295 RepID=A0A6P3XIU0_DINQU|nr:PREDICTED: nidogen-2 isoform X2 [Dinoponera quadriceps]
MARWSVLLLGLLAVAGLIAPFAAALSRNDLHPYMGPGAYVLQTDPNGMLTSAEAILQTPVVFYDKTYSSIFVNGNGVLSFARAMQRFFNIAFPLDDPVISPLYTHVDTRASGTVYWRETDSSEILARTGGLVRSAFKDAADFVPTHVFLATWLDVGYYNQRKDKVNTYQVAISSNGTHSFVELLYPENGIQWIQGESHPNGLPDAKAQAGFMSEGKMYTLRGSGTDQIQNVDKWSNVNRPGQWLFQIGPIDDGGNVKTPDNIEDTMTMHQAASCRTGATTCHSKATCIEYEIGFCCSCKQGFFGNGKSCQPNDVPLRVIGRISGTINDIEFPSRDLQCYVQTQDGRTYTALSRVPEEIGASFQLLGNLGFVIGWLFAKPIRDTENGYELTGGLFNHTAELDFPSTGDKVTIRSNYLGLDVFGQLKMEADIKGTLPYLETNTSVDYGDYDELYTRAQPGVIRTESERTCKLSYNGNEREISFTQDQIITYQECPHAIFDPEDDTTRLKFSRGLTSYEAPEGIIRFAVNTKITPLEEEDPCIQGQETCGIHSSCVVDGDSFKCVCHTGYQYLYDVDGNAVCVDVNECTAGNHMCSPNAQCINQEGSHLCHCRHGFTGDGRVCEKLPSCEDTRCGNYERCTMMDGTPMCTCMSGFEKTDQGCSPIQQVTCNEDDNCSPFAFCSSGGDRKGHVCVCMPGYIGDGYTCYSEADVTTTDAPPQPECLLEMCWCPDGWYFHNNACVRRGEGYPPEIDYDDRDYECSEDSDCRKNERCTLHPSSSRYECTCMPKYSQVGDECVLTDCSMNPSECHENAKCTSVGDDKYKCVCLSGYHGDGIGQCVQDHIGCNVVNNCGRNAVCAYNQSYASYACMCQPGYYGDGFTCFPQFSCMDEPSLCSPDATCVSVGENIFACVCKEGYTGDGANCKRRPKHEANFLLVNQGMATHRIPFIPTQQNPGYPIYIDYKQMAIALDIDCSDGKAYSSDITGNRIVQLSYNGSISGTFIPKVSSPEGLSVDWVSRNIFWTDSGKTTVEVASLLTKKRKVLVSDGLVNPRGIAVHPYRGKIFWSDWNRASPKLEWANEDGTDRAIFLQSDYVKLPNSLSIDWLTDELCWADAGTFTISCIEIDSREVNVVANELTYPFGLAISQNYYYWTDWKTHKIEVGIKSTGEKQTPLSVPPGGSGKLYGIVVVPESCPNVNNVCQYDNGRCSKDQLCLPDGQGGRTCACADDAKGPCTDSHYPS